jgi:hypothetical protein
MNLLFTMIDTNPTLEAQMCLDESRNRHHLVEEINAERIPTYLRLDNASRLALVDAIVCMADSTPVGAYRMDSPLEKALRIAADVRNLPESCAMRDGRKWRSIPFVVFCDSPTSRDLLLQQRKSHARVFPIGLGIESVKKIEDCVDEYDERLLEGYSNCGILVRIESGRAQIGPALAANVNRAENEYYYGLRDRRKHRKWVTVKRDRQGLRYEVELFRMLLDRRASETEMHRFFEEHPSFLMEARLGIPVSHRPRFHQPEDNTPDYSISPILGPWGKKGLELLELKGTDAEILRKGAHPGFSAKVSKAVDQVRDYGRYLKDPANMDAILRDLGYIPDDSKLAVLIGREPRNDEEREIFEQRQTELNVKVITYDEVLAVQENKLAERGPYKVLYGSADYPIL